MQQNPQAQLIAGGTDLGLSITQQLHSWSSVVHIGGLAELNSIRHEANQLIVGASVSVAELLNVMTLDFPDAVPMLLRFGSEQVRSQATVGGNLGTASPIGDLPPLLLALNASIELVSLSDTATLQTRILALSEYFTAYRQTKRRENEWIYAVHIPLASPEDVLRVYKVSKRMDDDISSVCAAIWLQIGKNKHVGHRNIEVEDIRLAYGGMAAIPKRATQAEKALRQGSLNEETIAQAVLALLEDFQPIDDARASAEYRMRIAGNLLRRLQLELTQPDMAVHISSAVMTGGDAA